MTQAYKYSILYFLLFSLLLLLSGALLFEHKIGFSAEAVLEYYLGSDEKFIPEKTAGGILKLALPHFFAFALFAMVILHFLVFTKERNKKKTKVIILFTFITVFLEITTPLLIISGFEFFAYIKIVSFIVFELLILYASWLLFHSIMYD